MTGEVRTHSAQSAADGAEWQRERSVSFVFLRAKHFSDNLDIYSPFVLGNIYATMSEEKAAVSIKKRKW